MFASRPEWVSVHPDGTILAHVSTLTGNTNQLQVIGINPTTGAQKFSVPQSGRGTSDMIVAGDGYAYVPSVVTDDSARTAQVKLLRVDTSGAYNEFDIFDYSGRYWYLYQYGFPSTY